MPSPAAYGIDEGKYTVLLDTMASQALASGSPGNNPVVPTAPEIIKLYKDVYRGAAEVIVETAPDAVQGSPPAE